MDGGSGDGVRTIGTGRGRGREECLGPARLARRRGNDEKRGCLAGFLSGQRGERERWGSARRRVGKGGRGRGSFEWPAIARERRSMAWLTRRGIEGGGDTDRWARGYSAGRRRRIGFDNYQTDSN
jgi:hypothetical protein